MELSKERLVSKVKNIGKGLKKGELKYTFGLKILRNQKGYHKIYNFFKLAKLNTCLKETHKILWTIKVVDYKRFIIGMKI